MALSPYSSNTYDPEKKNNTWYKMIHMVPMNAKVLDIGCSAGNFGEALREERNAVVDGIDITAADVEVAKKHLRKAWTMNVETDKLPNEKYDVVVFADVLEHMKDPVAVLKKVKKLLTPKGMVVFSIPNMAHLSVRLGLLAGKFSYTETGLLDYTHLHFYEEDEVRRIFHDAGFEIAKFDCTTFDFPKKLIEEKLSHLGLKPSATFFELAASRQATIFEYVGYAQVSSQTASAPSPRLRSSPVDEVSAYIARLEAANKSQIKDLKAKIKLSEQHIQKLEIKLEEERVRNAMPLTRKLYERLRRK